ncbi:MAG: asparagine synthase (glutamine-hydrolyzing) [Kofleriaceae bacterium]
MCGIAGFAGLALGDDPAARLLGQQQQALAHRGPDGTGRYWRDGVGLAHTRLAIVDVARGAQPMHVDDATIVYNGEVYNAPALRAELEADGERCATASDTEVVLRLYRRDPDGFERRLVGMWALAIHDRRRRRLVLSRDRFGIKPLFVAPAGRGVVFGSELGALRVAAAHLGDALAVDPAAAHAMLAWGYVPERHTIHRGVRRLGPGTRLVLDLAHGTSTETIYYRPRPDPGAAAVRSLDDAADLVAPALARAGREHLESDVPVAAFLSGGIDSSLVLAATVDASARPVQAFTIGFADPRFDEAPHARAVAARLGVPLEVEVLDEAALLAALPDALAAYDEPFGDSSSLPSFVLARLVGRTHKVAVGGDGGDEVFAGYKKHRIVRLWDAADRVPGGRALAAAALARLPARTDRTTRVGELLRTVGRLARGLGGDDAAGYVALTQVADLARTAPMLARPGGDALVAEVAARFQSATGDRLRRTLIADLGNVLPNDMLTKVDRATMACQLEARVPLLDHRIVELGLGLPRPFTLGTRGKEVLRRLFARRFGVELARRRKQGFGVPVERWLDTALAPACARLFERRRLERHGVLSTALADGGHRAWLAEHPYLVWHALALAAWCELVLGDGPDAVRELVAAPRQALAS